MINNQPVIYFKIHYLIILMVFGDNFLFLSSLFGAWSSLRRNKMGLMTCGQLSVLPGRNVLLALKKYMHRAAQPLLEEAAQCQQCHTKHFGKGCFRFAHQDIYDLIQVTEGHLSVHVLVYPVQSNKCAWISVSTIEAVGLSSTLHRVVTTVAQALPLPYAHCEWCFGKHKQTSCPLAHSQKT